MRLEVKEKMPSTLAIIVVALLLTGVWTATVYALPLIQQMSGAQIQNRDVIQSQDRLCLRACSQSGAITQTQERFRLNECSQNCECLCDEGSVRTQGDLEQIAGNAYQNRLGEQVCICSQHRNQWG